METFAWLRDHFVFEDSKGDTENFINQITLPGIRIDRNLLAAHA